MASNETDRTRPVLVVDLDGTLIRSDMLLESFWCSLSRDWRTPFFALASLVHGRAALKARMAAGGMADVATLPYTEPMLDHLRAWRAAGGRTALVTASDQSVADAIAGHLQLFDEVHGSNGHENLKGEAKADYLRQRFGERGFIYAGDCSADLPVWRVAAGALTVGLGAPMRAQVEALHPDATHLAPPQPRARAALRAMRPHQWFKNTLVFVPMITAHDFTLAALFASVLAALAFSLVASSVYLLNDMLDLASDRAHTRKRFRPLASGALPLATGMAMVPVLLVLGLAAALVLPAMFMLVLAGYYLLTIGYSLWLKRLPIIDICVLASLYTLRVAGGAAATGLDLSIWLLAFSTFLFFALAAVKRQAELVDMAQRGEDHAAGRGYQAGDLPVVTQMAVASGFVAILVLMLYLNEPSVRINYHHPVPLWGACLVLLYWISRMVLLAQRGKMDDDPTAFAAKDPTSVLVAVIIAALFTSATLL